MLPVDQYQTKMQMRFINENKVPIAVARGHVLATSRERVAATGAHKNGLSLWLKLLTFCAFYAELFWESATFLHPPLPQRQPQGA